mmetsp:Transcript_153757/g.493010  ORF Transcript_153757/g.493010 Transcript_153757/m.493010 type:complete len:228 (-) Transcript_153757:2191-2874(-)
MPNTKNSRRSPRGSASRNGANVLPLFCTSCTLSKLPRPKTRIKVFFTSKMELFAETLMVHSPAFCPCLRRTSTASSGGGSGAARPWPSPRPSSRAGGPPTLGRKSSPRPTDAPWINTQAVTPKFSALQASSSRRNHGAPAKVCAVPRSVWPASRMPSMRPVVDGSLRTATRGYTTSKRQLWPRSRGGAVGFGPASAEGRPPPFSLSGPERKPRTKKCRRPLSLRASL